MIIAIVKLDCMSRNQSLGMDPKSRIPFSSEMFDAY